MFVKFSLFFKNLSITYTKITQQPHARPHTSDTHTHTHAHAYLCAWGSRPSHDPSSDKGCRLAARAVTSGSAAIDGNLGYGFGNRLYLTMGSLLPMLLHLFVRGNVRVRVRVRVRGGRVAFDVVVGVRLK